MIIVQQIDLNTLSILSFIVQQEICGLSVEKSEHPLPLKVTNSSGALLFSSTGDGTPDLHMVQPASALQLGTLWSQLGTAVCAGQFYKCVWGEKVWCTPLISVFGRQRQFEFEAKSSLHSKFHASRGYVERPCFRQKHPKTKSWWDGKMIDLLTALVALPWDPCSIPSTHPRWLSTSSKGSVLKFFYSLDCSHGHGVVAFWLAWGNLVNIWVHFSIRSGGQGP